MAPKEVCPGCGGAFTSLPLHLSSAAAAQKGCSAAAIRAARDAPRATHEGAGPGGSRRRRRRQREAAAGGQGGEEEAEEQQLDEEQPSKRQRTGSADPPHAVSAASHSSGSRREEGGAEAEMGGADWGPESSQAAGSDAEGRGGDAPPAVRLTAAASSSRLLRPGSGGGGAGGGGGGGAGVPGRGRAPARLLTRVEEHALQVTPLLPNKLANTNLRLLSSGHPDEMCFGNLPSFKKFLVDQTGLVRLAPAACSGASAQLWPWRQSCGAGSGSWSTLLPPGAHLLAEAQGCSPCASASV